jgi:hypothetical protein
MIKSLSWFFHLECLLFHVGYLLVLSKFRFSCLFIDFCIYFSEHERNIFFCFIHVYFMADWRPKLYTYVLALGLCSVLVELHWQIAFSGWRLLTAAKILAQEFQIGTRIDCLARWQGSKSGPGRDYQSLKGFFTLNYQKRKPRFYRHSTPLTPHPGETFCRPASFATFDTLRVVGKVALLEVVDSPVPGIADGLGRIIGGALQAVWHSKLHARLVNVVVAN